jgi:hypothetical protein
VEISPDGRAAFLVRTCGDNHALRAAVEALLRASERPGGVLMGPDDGRVDHPVGQDRVGPVGGLAENGPWDRARSRPRR